MSTRPQFSPVVQIKAGKEKSAIFITHGLCGTVQFSELAKQIRTGHTVYGIRAKGLDGKEEPFERVEDMATFYLDELAQLPPHDPCILIGYSFGGLVALEMAHRLSENSKSVALLVLVDTYPHPRFIRPLLRLRVFLQRLRNHASQMRQMSLPNAFSYFVNGLKRRLPFYETFQDSTLETLNSSFSEKARQQVKEKAHLAFASYQPRFYRGRVKFVTTEIKSFFPGDPVAVWKDVLTDLEVEVIPGDHLNIVTTHFEVLASVLTRYIKQISTSQEAKIEAARAKVSKP